MIDFSRVEFNKEIKTAVAIKQIVASKYPPVKLGSIAKIEKGQTITQSEATPGKIKVIAGGLNYAYMHNQANRGADIITVSASGANAGFVNFWNEPIFASDCITLLGKTKDETLFIYNYLKSIQNYIFSLAHGSAQPHVYGSDLENIQVPFPPKEIQQQIISECEKIDTEYWEASKAIENAQQQIETTVISLTGKSILLGDIAEFKNGLNYDRNSQGAIIKIVGVKDFENKFSPNWELIESIQIDGNLKADYLLKEQDILIVRSNGSRNLVGRCIYIDETHASTSFSGFTIRLRLNSSIILPKLLCYYLRTDFVRSKMFEGSKGSNIKSINQDILANIPVNIPDQITQKAIIRQIQRFEQQIDAAQKILDSAFASKQEILNKYLQ